MNVFHPLSRIVLFFCAGLFHLPIGAFAAEQGTATSTREIEALLRYVAGLDSASFVRNGEAHTPKEAEAHLRLKWNQQKKDVHTAEDFIRLCATKSSVSGKPYSIKFKDGREEEAASVLGKHLATLRDQDRPPAK